jgi:hypothetical protein
MSGKGGKDKPCPRWYVSGTGTLRAAPPSLAARLSTAEQPLRDTTLVMDNPPVNDVNLTPLLPIVGVYFQT